MLAPDTTDRVGDHSTLSGVDAMGRRRLPTMVSGHVAGGRRYRRRGPQGGDMAETCTHSDSNVTRDASGNGCVECLATGGRWVHLRRCPTCTHVGCCDTSPGRHATFHFHET